MQYNESLYNGDSYNLTEYSQTLVETITPSDADVLKSIGIVKTDSQNTADAVGGSASLQAFLETVSLFQRARTPFAYNNGMYNQYMYNARLDEDEILLHVIKALVDSLTLTDDTVLANFTKVLLEMVTGSDTVVFSTDQALFEFVFADDFMRIDFTNKALNDTVRLAAWVSIERNPPTEVWFD